MKFNLTPFSKLLLRELPFVSTHCNNKKNILKAQNMSLTKFANKFLPVLGTISAFC